MSCIVCGNNNAKSLYGPLLRCANCSFVWSNLDISKEQLNKIYDDNYFFGGEYVDYLEEKRALKKNFERNLKIIMKFCSSGRLLEIGCAYGFFLDLARRHYEVQGIDINSNACKYALEQLELNVICGDFLEIEFEKNYYDIIVMWATLEHLRYPNLYIKKISSLLRKNGIFACSTIDIDSVLSKIQKKRWRQIHPPTHLSYFSEKTLSMLLSRSDLERIQTLRLGEYRTINNILYTILVLRDMSPHLYSLIKRLNLNKGVLNVNMYDTIYLVASKNNLGRK